MRRAFRFYFINILMAVVIIAIVSVVGITMFCSVHSVTVNGSSIYSPEEIQALVLDGKYPNNTVYQVIQNKIKPKKNIPFVKKIRVSFAAYDKLVIQVSEKQCVGYLALENEGYAYFDEDGKVVEISERLVENAIGVTGIILKKAEVGEKVELEKEQLEFMVQLLKSLNKYELKISGLSFDEQGNATASCGDLLLSVGKADSLEDKMMRIPYILPQLEGQVGILHLENWTKENTDIVFEKTK